MGLLLTMLLLVFNTVRGVSREICKVNIQMLVANAALWMDFYFLPSWYEHIIRLSGSLFALEHRDPGTGAF